jgi:ATP synthase protein I
MPTLPPERGEMSQDSAAPPLHRNVVSPTTRRARAFDPASANSRRAFEALSASSVGLELGISVVLGLLFGWWLDQQAGTTPWLMLVFLVFGLVAGFRGVFRAVRRAERAAEADGG